MDQTLLRIKNKQGMMALADAAAITPDYKIAYLSLVGAQTAVKAIWASVISRRTPLTLDYKTIYGDGDAEYVVLRHTLAQGVHRWVLFPDPGPSAPYLLLIPLQGLTTEAQLVHLLNQHTLWPVRAEWGETLLERGKAENLVVELIVYGNLPWAYAVNPIGWDEVIDAAAQAGDLAFACLRLPVRVRTQTGRQAGGAA
jgi:hypothetical protein